MDNIHIICISDIHFQKNSPENQGLVVREFFKDLPNVIKGIDRSDLYCIIAGDLVQAGGLERSYEDFSNIFLSKLTKFVDLDHIICIPGNHDLNRNLLSNKKWRKQHEELLGINESEENLNSILKAEDSIIRKKFQHYDDFVKANLKMLNYDLYGFSVNLIPEVSIYCLNSALFSNGGLEGLPKDEGILKIETSGLYKWAAENEGRTRILVMHHPLEHLSEYVRNEIENILRKDVDILITGHLHRQSFKTYLGVETELCKFCSSPQLFSDKRDQNGYSVLHFEGQYITSIEYRKWSTFNEEFSVGSEFSKTNDGKIVFKQKLFAKEDIILDSLQRDYDKSLRIYKYTPSWVDRTLSNLPPQSKQTENKVCWDHMNVINATGNIQIIGGAQFGLTCFLKKCVLEAWIHKQKHWLYIDATDLRLSKVDSIIDDFIAERQISNDGIDRILIDNWNKTRDDKTKVLSKCRTKASGAKILIANKEEDSALLKGLEEDGTLNDFESFYLCALDRKGIRKITFEFIKKQNFEIEDNDKILERLILELLDLNIHRTPVNCIQLLMNFQQNYESKPINRSKILTSLLQFFFLKPDSFYYTETIDEDDCKIIMGALCEYLMRHNDGRYFKRLFSEDEFLVATNNIAQRSYTTENRKLLLQAMEDAQIIVKYMGSYEFRFSYWVYFFTACQMYSSQLFYEYMIVEQNCILMPDIIEFYSGIDQKCDAVVELMIKHLTELSHQVSASLGVSINNPYKTLKCRPNPLLESKTREQIEQDIQASQLPEELKDAIADKTYQIQRPYFQTIETVIDKLNVRNMMSLCRSASRAFRNSNLISEEKRIELFNAIQLSWYSLFEVLVLLTPALACTGHGTMGGANFLLTEDFKNDEDPQKKLISIVTAIPYNIVCWYRDDVYSEKRSDVYYKAITSINNDEVKRHINVLLVIASRPKGWPKLVDSYIKSVNRNSFYLGDVRLMLGHCYSTETLSIQDQKTMKRLIADSIEKFKGGHKLDLPNSAIYIPKK